MNLALLGFLMVATFMTLIMTKRMTPLVALIVIPSLFGVIAGQAAGLGDMMIDGIKNLAPTGVMLLFAILFFSTMTDTGLFEHLRRARAEYIMQNAAPLVPDVQSPAHEAERKARAELDAASESINEDMSQIKDVQYQHADASVDTTDAEKPLAAAPAPFRSGPKVGRNDPCHCGSGKKYKHCHGQLA
jgi:uncharacterized protein YchJ